MCPTTSTIMGQTFTNFVFLEPDGSEHALLPQGADGVQGNSCGSGNSIVYNTPNSQPYSRGPWFVAWDDSNIRFLSNVTFTDDTDTGDYSSGSLFNPMSANGTLYFPDGRQYTIQNGLVTQITDRNGNVTRFQYTSANFDDTSPGTVYPNVITEPTGRQYHISYSDSSCTTATMECDLITYPGQDNHSTETITVRYAELQNAMRSDLSAPGSLFPTSGINYVTTVEGIAGELVLSEIDLPNSASWKFYYDPYGEIAKVVLPTGGAIEYDYGPGLTNAGASGSGADASGMVLSALNFNGADPPPPWQPFVYRRLLQRREYNLAISGETNQKRTSGTESLISSYPLFETATNPLTISGLVYSLAIQSTGKVAVNESGVNMAPVSELHEYHDGGNTVSGGYIIPPGFDSSALQPGGDIADRNGDADVPRSFPGKGISYGTML